MPCSRSHDGDRAATCHRLGTQLVPKGSFLRLHYSRLISAPHVHVIQTRSSSSPVSSSPQYSCSRMKDSRVGGAPSYQLLPAFNPLSIATSGTRSARATCARLSRLMDFSPRSTSPRNLPERTPWQRGDSDSNRASRAAAADGGRTRRGASAWRGDSLDLRQDRGDHSEPPWG